MTEHPTTDETTRRGAGGALRELAPITAIAAGAALVVALVVGGTTTHVIAPIARSSIRVLADPVAVASGPLRSRSAPPSTTPLATTMAPIAGIAPLEVALRLPRPAAEPGSVRPASTTAALAVPRATDQTAPAVELAPVPVVAVPVPVVAVPRPGSVAVDLPAPSGVVPPAAVTTPPSNGRSRGRAKGHGVTKPQDARVDVTVAAAADLVRLAATRTASSSPPSPEPAAEAAPDHRDGPGRRDAKVHDSGQGREGDQGRKGHKSG